eukprot:TRINITY_DN22216_c0_g1_i6.p1 TRINITY_DN22216_c0_g1~~TRINITY_DN22216_c0_g1_i6.p1  ORF type:complete len:245 (+),score=88.02 TRINITY_DN22216_c0_g1_i6:87-821(+)
MRLLRALGAAVSVGGVIWCVLRRRRRRQAAERALRRQRAAAARATLAAAAADPASGEVIPVGKAVLVDAVAFQIALYVQRDWAPVCSKSCFAVVLALQIYRQVADAGVYVVAPGSTQHPARLEFHEVAAQDSRALATAVRAQCAAEAPPAWLPLTEREQAAAMWRERFALRAELHAAACAEAHLRLEELCQLGRHHYCNIGAVVHTLEGALRAQFLRESAEARDEGQVLFEDDDQEWQPQHSWR